MVHRVEPGSADLFGKEAVRYICGTKRPQLCHCCYHKEGDIVWIAQSPVHFLQRRPDDTGAISVLYSF